MPLCKWITFWMISMFNLLFYCQIILCWVKVTSYEKSYPQSYLWSRNYLENFSVLMLSMEVWKCWQIVEFPEISIKIKNFKTFYETQTASRLNELFSLSLSLPPSAAPLTSPDKSLLRLCNKYFLMEIYINIQIVFEVLRECSSWVSRNVQCKCFFLTPTRCFLENL